MNRLLSSLIPLIAVAACSAASPIRLEDQVTSFHDALRWGRLPVAEQSVHPSLRERFARRHANWGRSVRIVDLELEAVRFNGLVGTVRTRYTWTRMDEVDTRETVIETRWHPGIDTQWVCDDERIVSGDPTLFATR